VLHSRKSPYEVEILETLRLNGGQIIGFNELLSKRASGSSFHPTRAAEALRKLEKDGEIKIEETGFGKQKKYILIEHDLEKSFEQLTKELKKIEMQFNTPKITNKEKIFLTSNYLQLGLHKIIVLEMLQIGNDILDLKKSKLENVKKLKEKLRQDLQSKFNELSIEGRKSTFNMLWNFEKEPNLWSLQKYRDWFHKPSANEKRAEKIAVEEELERLFQKDPYCLFCGHKSKNHKESEKHNEVHLKNVEKDTIEVFKNFEGVYCSACGKLVGTVKQLEKHKCKIKKTKRN